VRSTAAAEAKKTEAAAKTDSADEPIATALKMDDLKVELGYALLPW
jgi:flagellar biosynthesis protein FlhA